MDYLKSGPFSVQMAGGKKYRDNFDAIDWGTKSEPEPTENPNYDTIPLVDIEGSIQHDVHEFHRVMGQPILTTPCVPDADRVRLRLRLILEEFTELLTACGIPEPTVVGIGVYRDIIKAIDAVKSEQVDLVEVADALGDIAYVVEGMCLELGINSETVLAEIQRSNLSKLGEDGKPVYNADGKVTKGPNYSPPNIAEVLGL